MKKFAIVLGVVAAVVLLQGLTATDASTVDRILADASLAMAVPFILVAIAFWQVDEK